MKTALGGCAKRCGELCLQVLSDVRRVSLGPGCSLMRRRALWREDEAQGSLGAWVNSTSKSKGVPQGLGTS